MTGSAVTKYSMRRKMNKDKHTTRAYMFLTLGVLATSYHFYAGAHGNNASPGSMRLVSDGRRLTGTPAAPIAAPVVNATVVAVSNFPKDLFTAEDKKNGAILLHIYLALVTFYGIAILCDNYFEPALECLCEAFDLKEDVAGATFMAAGGSAPELATSIMGLFVSKSDIGIGTIVGSAVFNVLFVIAVCAWAAPGLPLSWWPLARDCTYYCFSIQVLVLFVLDQQIEGYEAIVLLLLYVGYVLIMKYNEKLQVSVTRIVDHQEGFHEKKGKMRQTAVKLVENNIADVFIYVVITVNVVATFGFDDSKVGVAFNEICGYIYMAEFAFKIYGYGFFGYWMDALNAFDGVLVYMVIVEILLLSNSSWLGSVRAVRIFRFFRMIRILRILRLYRAMSSQKVDKSTQTDESVFSGENGQADELIDVDGGSEKSEEASKAEPAAPAEPVKKNQVVPVPAAAEDKEADKERGEGGDGGKGGEEEEEDDDEDEGPFDPFELPDGVLGKIVTVVNLPVVLLMYYTIPDVGHPGKLMGIFPNNKKFLVTFFMCIVWITILSYFMVWMATEFGLTTGIPDPVMGLTFLAAGTSIPDAMSSLAVARRGFGDMAVSSSIGSNIFDILIGLPVPWCIKTLIVDGAVTGDWEDGKAVQISSEGLPIMIITLFVMVALVITCIHLANWKLTKNLGYIFMFLYVLFVIESLCLEYGVF